jgi:hypothetical protein
MKFKTWEQEEWQIERNKDKFSWLEAKWLTVKLVYGSPGKPKLMWWHCREIEEYRLVLKNIVTEGVKDQRRLCYFKSE